MQPDSTVAEARCKLQHKPHEGENRPFHSLLFTGFSGALITSYINGRSCYVVRERIEHESDLHRDPIEEFTGTHDLRHAVRSRRKIALVAGDNVIGLGSLRALQKFGVARIGRGSR